jgi:hypothetical protein
MVGQVEAALLGGMQRLLVSSRRRLSLKSAAKGFRNGATACCCLGVQSWSALPLGIDFAELAKRTDGQGRIADGLEVCSARPVSFWLAGAEAKRSG